MARPRTQLGTAGNVTTVGQVQLSGKWVSTPDGVKPTRWRARTKYRDTDGVLRDVERFDRTKAKAVTKLQGALADRRTPTKGGDFRSDMSLMDAGTNWLEQVDRPDSKLSDSTREQYRAAYDRYLSCDDSPIRGLTLREVNRVQQIERFIQGVADKHGTGAAKTARTCLSSIISMAVRYGVLDFNAAREVRPAKARKPKETERDTQRALTREQREQLLAVADDHAAAKHADVADIVYWLAGTGVRISEALGQQWDDVNLKTGAVHVRGTKTTASDRVIFLPEWLRERMTERAERIPTYGLVFPTPSATGIAQPSKSGGGGHAIDLGKPRDRRNVTRVLSKVFESAGLPWATAHSLRRTVASDIDRAGLGVAIAADVLGHADPAMTARVYLGRKTDTSSAAKAL